jgi:GDP-mannose transporter
MCFNFFRCFCDDRRRELAQFVVSGRNFSMNFLLLCIQSFVCVLCVLTVKKLGIISFRNFDTADAKAWFPISFLLVTVIYSGSKSLVSPTNLPSRQVDNRVIER